MVEKQEFIFVLKTKVISDHTKLIQEKLTGHGIGDLMTNKNGIVENFNLENLDLQEIKKIKSLAGLDELNIFYDRNKIIVALCNKILELMKKQVVPSQLNWQSS